MENLVDQFLNGQDWWAFIIKIAFYFLFAYLVHKLGRRIARRLLKISRFAPKGRRINIERQATLEMLLASMIALLAYIIALAFSLSLFISSTTLVWMIGLFSAAFGLGARPIISDFLTGVGFLFEDTFSVGEKVEIAGFEGVVEALQLRHTLLRSSTGELYVVPNGEIRVIRNFSRGKFSIANVTLKVNSADVFNAIQLLEELSEEAMLLLPNLSEPWRVINDSGTVGEHVSLIILAHARFGKAAEMRPRLLALLHERFQEASISLVD